MKFFIRYIVDIIIGLFKKAWYHIRMQELKKELEKEKKEAQDAKKVSDSFVDDFESEYRMFRDSEKTKESEDGSGNSSEGNSD